MKKFYETPVTEIEDLKIEGMIACSDFETPFDDDYESNKDLPDA